jgi:hypothetical protein
MQFPMATFISSFHRDAEKKGHSELLTDIASALSFIFIAIFLHVFTLFFSFAALRLHDLGPLVEKAANLVGADGRGHFSETLKRGFSVFISDTAEKVLLSAIVVRPKDKHTSQGSRRIAKKKNKKKRKTKRSVYVRNTEHGG